MNKESIVNNISAVDVINGLLTKLYNLYDGSLKIKCNFVIDSMVHSELLVLNTKEKVRIISHGVSDNPNNIYSNTVLAVEYKSNISLDYVYRTFEGFAGINFASALLLVNKSGDFTAGLPRSLSSTVLDLLKKTDINIIEHGAIINNQSFINGTMAPVVKEKTRFKPESTDVLTKVIESVLGQQHYTDINDNYYYNY